MESSSFNLKMNSTWAISNSLFWLFLDIFVNGTIIHLFRISDNNKAIELGVKSPTTATTEPGWILYESINDVDFSVFNIKDLYLSSVRFQIIKSSFSHSLNRSNKKSIKIINTPLILHHKIIQHQNPIELK